MKKIKGLVRLLFVFAITIICISTNSKAVECSEVSEDYNVIATVDNGNFKIEVVDSTEGFEPKLEKRTTRQVSKKDDQSIKDYNIYQSDIITPIIEEEGKIICRNTEQPQTTQEGQKENANNNHEGDWFYGQLNTIERCIYNGFESNRGMLINGQEASIMVGNYTTKPINEEYYIQAAIIARRAYLADHPAEKIWSDNCEYKLAYYDGEIKIIVEPKDGKNVRNETLTFEQKAEEFIQNLYGTETEKLQQIHDWLITNVVYDKTTENNGNVYGALVEGRSVCSGYAYAFKYLADKAGLNVIYVQGHFYYEKTGETSYHAWNMALVDGQWTLIDVTMDKDLGDKYLFASPNTGAHYPDTVFSYPL